MTGASGHLGNTIVRALLARGESVRVLVQPQDPAPALADLPLERVSGDVTDAASWDRLLQGAAKPICLIHLAAIVTISEQAAARVRAVNIGGVDQMLAACSRTAVDRVLYVSSVHALPEDRPSPQTESRIFDPDRVTGVYGKTKAIATAKLLAAAGQGLDVRIVHPSGICGPGDYGRGHLTDLLLGYLQGRMRTLVPGGYDLVDVRDVAAGILAAIHYEKQSPAAETWLLTGRYYTIQAFLDLAAEISGQKPVRRTVPLWLARAALPLINLVARLTGRRPLYTAYSLFTISGNVTFSHEKAARELAYQPRDMRETIADTIAFFEARGDKFKG